MNKTVKIWRLAALIAISSGCSKQPDEMIGTGPGSVDYVLYAEDVTTRTATDGSFNVKWTDGDNLAVYVWPADAAVVDDTEYWQKTNPVAFVAEAGDVSPRPFSLSETDVENSATGVAYSDRLDAFKTRFRNNNSLKWGVIYPGWQSFASKPGMGIVEFGNNYQEGNDNMERLACQDVLWGTAVGKTPTVGMCHIGTMMVYTVKNATASPFTVKSITISAPGVTIAGKFRFNVFEGTIDSCQESKTECKLGVTDAAAIPANGSAVFYQVLAPFTMNAGSSLTMSVETDKGTWSKQMTFTAAKKFESGKRNTATLAVVGLEPPAVEIRDKKLYVNGEEFFVKGVALNGDNKDSSGKQEFWKDAKAAGANVVRLYSVTSQSKTLLDELAADGMYAYVGLNVGRIIDGFDYTSNTARDNQKIALKSIINNLKGHPAILMWCIGNELEQNNLPDGSGQIDTFDSEAGKNLWADVNEISQYIHSVDNRPTTFALCWPWGVNARVPDIDFISINQYAPSVYSLHANMIAKVPDKPYLITEYGPQGTWEDAVGKTSWGGLIEDSGSTKAGVCKDIYDNCILCHKNDGCIGSFVFLWGYQSHGAVATWYAMYDQFSKYSLPSVDVMTELWSGSVSNRAPVISDSNCLTVNGKTAGNSVYLKRGEAASASVVAYDLDGDALSYTWKIVKDQYLPAGTLMQEVSTRIVGTGSSIVFEAPDESGAYRLLVWAQDKVHKNADLAVFPFYVTTEECTDTYTYGDNIDKWENGYNLNF
ncbi:MAG: glycoside hydrolase family 2 TIM barrel-domain containing protein [Candidatus Cryptobacteroides sp.]